MFNYTIDNKPLIKDKNGIEIRNLCASTFKMDNVMISNYKVYKIPQGLQMRPDLISNSLYGTIAYTEMVLKYNAISNPFSVCEDDIIIAPDKDDILNIVSSAAKISDSALVNKAYKYIDPQKFPTTLPSSSSDFDNRFTQSSNGAGSILPPNISDGNENQIIHRNGRVYFGENIGVPCLSDGITTSKYIETVIKNK
ncbi:MAG: hypothetical protein ACRDD8_14225 [Bacteroidales bacterium]